MSLSQGMEESVSADVPGEKMASLIVPDLDLKHVLDVLEAGGYGAWIVGGAVRDSLLGLEVMEYDICTDATPDEIIESFEDTIPTGKRFGTITVRSGDKMYEITTLRTESGYGDGRRPDVVNWGNSLYVDLSRRDFTINSMAYDCKKELLHDPFNGKEDLEKGHLRAVGKASNRLSEDGLRIMRAYRFMDRGLSGVWNPDFELSNALVDNVSMLDMVSIERIWAELERIILGRNASKILERMNNDGILNAIFGLPISNDCIIPLSNLEFDLEARLAMIFSKFNEFELESVMKKMKVSKNVSKRTKKLHSLIDIMPSKIDLRIYRNTLGDEAMVHADLRDALGRDIELIKKSLQYPYDIKCLIDGEWLMSRTGLSPGIRLGRLKDWLHRVQIERNYTDISQMETALCSIQWQHGEVDNWPKPVWP